MRKYFTVFFFILLAIITQAQDSLPRIYEVKNDSSGSYWEEIDQSFWQMLEDKDGKWSIDDVRNEAINKNFHSKADNKVNTFWFRYRLRNMMVRPAEISLNSNTAYDDFYVLKADGNTDHFRSGTYRDWKDRDGLKYVNCIPIVLQPSEEVMVYQRTQVTKPGLPVDFSIVILHTKDLIKDAYVNYLDQPIVFFFSSHLIEAFMGGFLLVAFLYTIAFYRIVKEPEYLYFSLILLFLGINRMYNITSLSLERLAPAYGRYSFLLTYAWAFILFSEIQFTRHFFKTFIKSPKWDKVLSASRIAIILLFLTMAMQDMNIIPNSSLFAKLFLPIFGLIPLLLLITLFIFVRRSDRFGQLVIIGAFPFLFLRGVLGWIASDGQDPAKTPFPVIATFVKQNYRTIEAPCVLWFVLSFSLILFIRFNRLRKENTQQALDNERLAKEKEIERSELISKQKAELEIQVAERTAELSKSLEDLKATQSQLIQSEKMASLGELTAGIAHEIQNPLNFVNNFSEVNKELLTEMEQEIEKGNYNEVKLIAKDVIDNEEKINHHGKRADSIVKGMLQHSRTASSQKELTDINALADEYLRLSYHGLRAKDAQHSANKSFNATLKTEFDESIGQISIHPQEIGRVLLNLYNNAFYAVNEKKKQQPEAYEPTISVSTKKNKDSIEIKIIDNGNGIPQHIADKIFQPFFTTKPTGEGTGLGLSLAYDSIKAHGGEIKVKSEMGEYTEFSIILH